MFSFQPLINNSVTIGLCFLLLSISVILYQKQYFPFFIWVVLFNVFLNIIHIIMRIIKMFKSVLSLSLIKNQYFALYGPLACGFYQYLVVDLLH